MGVTLAGAGEPAARIVQRVVEQNGAGACRVLGTPLRAGAGDAALANGTAAHALDFDDMCFVSLAHPSAPLVAAALAAAELAGASGRALLDAYIVGFELEGRLGLAMNPRHYRRGWHCTSTLGTIGAAAAAARLLDLDAQACGARAGDRGVGGVGAEGKFRHDGQAAACRVGGEKWRAGGDAGARGNDRQQRGDRRTARISGGDGQRTAIARTRWRQTSARDGKSSRPASP